MPARDGLDRAEGLQFTEVASGILNEIHTKYGRLVDSSIPTFLFGKNGFCGSVNASPPDKFDEHTHLVFVSTGYES